jgi:hypothetical protein
MVGQKKKSIEKLETELAQLIANSGQSEQEIQQCFNDYFTSQQQYCVYHLYLESASKTIIKQYFSH